MTASAPISDHRRGMYAKLAIAKKQLGLDDDTYRSLLDSVTGKRSAKAMSDNELFRVLVELRNKGFSDTPKGVRMRAAGADSRNRKREAALPNAGTTAKIRALWLSLYNLGLVRDPNDKAIEAFVARQTVEDGRIQKLIWLSPTIAHKVIEALKQWAMRPPVKGGAGVDWSLYVDGRLCVLQAQRDILLKLGVFQYPSQLNARAYSLFARSDWRGLASDQLDALIKDLGSDIRKYQTKAGGQLDGA